MNKEELEQAKFKAKYDEIFNDDKEIKKHAGYKTEKEALEDYEQLNKKYNLEDVEGLEQAKFKAKYDEIFNDDEEIIKHNSYEVTKKLAEKQGRLNKKYNLVNVEGPLEVKTKQIQKTSLKEKFQCSIVIALIAAGLFSGTLTMVDSVQHPENYFTTHPDFDGRATFSTVLERTPDNLGIGR